MTVLSRRSGIVVLVLACLAAVGSGLSWLAARSTVDVAPIAAGQPMTTSLAFSPPMLLLTLVLATVSGVLTVIAIARLRRRG